MSILVLYMAPCRILELYVWVCVFVFPLWLASSGSVVLNFAPINVYTPNVRCKVCTSVMPFRLQVDCCRSAVSLVGFFTIAGCSAALLSYMVELRGLIMTIVRETPRKAYSAVAYTQSNAF